MQFLKDIEPYFCPKEIPDSVKLPIALKTVTDVYMQQWFIVRHKELGS